MASGGQNALGGATNYRKPQLPEKLQRNAFQQQESSLYHQFRRQQQPQPVEADGTGSNVRLPVAAAVVGQRPAPARRRPEREEKPSGTSRETKSESGAKQVSRANEITFGTNEDHHQASSAILLTVSFVQLLGVIQSVIDCIFRPVGGGSHQVGLLDLHF